jgi:hypothetical protein
MNTIVVPFSLDSLICRGHLLPLVKNRKGANHPNASYKGASSYATAMHVWNAAIRNGEVRLLTI